MISLVIVAVLLLGYIAALNTIIALQVLRDAGAADYRTSVLRLQADVLKLQAGVFTRLGCGGPIITRSRQQKNDGGDQADREEFPHDLMMRVGADR